MFNGLEKVSLMLWFVLNSIHLIQGIQDVFLMIRSLAYLFLPCLLPPIHPSIHPLYLSPVSSTHLYLHLSFYLSEQNLPQSIFPQFYFIYI